MTISLVIMPQSSRTMDTEKLAACVCVGGAQWLQCDEN